MIKVRGLRSRGLSRRTTGEHYTRIDREPLTTPSALLPRDRAARARELVVRFGPCTAALLGISLEEGGDAALGRWLLAACLADPRLGEERLLRAWRELELGDGDLTRPTQLASAAPARVVEILRGANHPKPEAAAGLLLRVAGALATQHRGSVEALAAGAEGLEDLAARIARLAPGVGRATVARFLQPLRQRWPAAGDLPLDPAAQAAAVHLGFLRPGQDEEGAPGALWAALRSDERTPALPDLEAALARLGRRACLRGRAERCPVGRDCPLRSHASLGS
jgi:hypothetical protein